MHPQNSDLSEWTDFNSRTEIGSLPDEVFHQICLYLDCESIKRFSITCTRFANIVANSSVILKKFKLMLTNNFWMAENELLRLRRKYSTIEIEDVRKDPHSAWSNIFAKFGPHLRTLFIHNTVFDDCAFLNILKCSPFLEELCLSEVYIEKKLQTIDPISIVHLTLVSIHHTNWLVFKFLSRSQITSLFVYNSRNEGEGARNHLISMLSCQRQLRELILYGTSSQTLFSCRDLIDTWNDPRLTTFHIICNCNFGRNSYDIDSNIVNFLSVNNNSLKEVAISIESCTRPSFYATFGLHNVTSLVLDVGLVMPYHESQPQPLVFTEPNLQLKHLSLSGYFVQSALIECFLSNCPAIVSLELHDWGNTISSLNPINIIGEKLPQLETLAIPTISKAADVLKFNALKRLHVSYTLGSKNLINFLQLNTSLVALKIGLVSNAQVLAICNLMVSGLTQVRHLSFAGNAKRLQAIFDLIKVNTPKTLITLRLCLLSSENYLIFFKKQQRAKTIQFNFPSNASDIQAKLDAFFNDDKSSD